jgi:hypothetical protein
MRLRHLTVEYRSHAIGQTKGVHTFADEPSAEPISGPVIARDADGEFVFAQWPVQARTTRAVLAWLAGTLPKVKFSKEARMSGFSPISSTFGWLSPAPIRKQYACTRCGFDRKNVRLASALERLIGELAPVVGSVIPQEYETYDRTVRALVHRDYLLAGTPYTSGVINDKTMLPYHADRSNVKDGISVQVNLRHDATGGALHFPEYGVWLANDDQTVVIFRGGSALHAVTPIHLHSTDAYRYSIVYYAKQGLKRCGPYADEATRAAQHQHSILRKRIDPDSQDESLA